MGAIIATIIIVIFTSLAAYIGEHTKVGQALVEKGVRWMSDV